MSFVGNKYYTMILKALCNYCSDIKNKDTIDIVNVHCLQTHQVWQLVDDSLPLPSVDLIHSFDGPALPVGPIHILTCNDVVLFLIYNDVHSPPVQYNMEILILNSCTILLHSSTGNSLLLFKDKVHLNEYLTCKHIKKSITYQFFMPVTMISKIFNLLFTTIN